MTLSVAVTPFLVLFNEKVIRRFKEEHAKVFVLAIDEVAASVRTAGMVRKPFPQVPIYARARNLPSHPSAHRAGRQDHLARDPVFHKLTEAVLEGLGQPAHETREVLKRFQRYHEQLLQRQYAVFRDETMLIQTTREAAEELKRLFKEDSQSEPPTRLRVDPASTAASAG